VFVGPTGEGGGIRGLLNGSTQELIDLFRKRFDIYRCLFSIDVSHLLPL
jgi:hypothetical protein